MPPWKVKRAQSQARGWSIDGLQQAIGVAAELNADVKGAAASADYALERAIRRIVAIRRETGRGVRGWEGHRPENATSPRPAGGGGSSDGRADAAGGQRERPASCLAMPDLRF